MVEKRFEKLGMPDIERFENYLPTAFNSELTLLQKVNKLIFDLIETNKLTNEMVDYLNRFIETFDEKLYETLEDVLNVWLEDGRLADIVRVAISEEVIEARTDYLGKKYVDLKERLDSEKAEVTDQLAHNANELDNVVSHLNFDTLDSAIAYCKTNDKKLVADRISLTKDTNLRGIELDIKWINTNGFKLELGGYNVYDVLGEGQQAVTNPNQKIETIMPSVSKAENELFIRGAIGQHITINQYYGTINIRMNETDKYNAYSTFNFGSVSAVKIGNDENVPVNTPYILWCNENIFNINRCTKFIIDGTYPHDFNRIYGGCFEGDSHIEIIKGRNNRFYDMRFENNTTTTTYIKFHPNTQDNIIFHNKLYYMDIIDEGFRNSVSYTGFNNARLLNTYSIKKDTFNETYNNGFKNIILTTDNLGLKPTDYSLTPILETEFIGTPKNHMFDWNCNLKVGNGLGMMYRVYDADYNDISDVWATVGQSFYYNPCNAAKIAIKDSGAYVLPGRQAGNTQTPTTIYNDRMSLYPSPYWNTYQSLITTTKPEIKYVKFFIIGTDYFGNNSEFYDLQARIYDMSANFHYHYFH